MRKVLTLIALTAYAAGSAACGGGRASVAQIGQAMAKPDGTVDQATTKAALQAQDDGSSGTAGLAGLGGSGPGISFIRMPEASIPAFVRNNGASIFSGADGFNLETYCAQAQSTGKVSLRQTYEAVLKQQNPGISISGDITIEMSCSADKKSLKWEIVYDRFDLSGTVQTKTYHVNVDGNMVWTVGNTQISGADHLYYRWATKIAGSVTEDTKTQTIKFFGGAAAIASADPMTGYKVKFAGAVLEANGKFLVWYYRDTDGNARSVAAGSGYAVLRGANGSFVFYGAGERGARKFCVWSASGTTRTFTAAEGFTQAECDGFAEASANLDTAFDVCATYSVLCN